MIKRTMRSRVVRVLGLSMATLLALMLSSCGSSGEDKSVNADGLTKVRVASAGMIPTSADLAWAIEGGFFKKNGLDVTLTPPLYASDLAQAVMNDSADLAMATGTLVASARAAGRKLTIVATHQAPFPLQIAFTPETDKALRNRGLSEASSVSDLLAALKGMTLGTSPVGSSITATYRYLLAQYGIDPERDNITLQAMPDVASQVAALSHGRVDGLASALGGSATGAVAQGAGVVWDLTKMKGSEALQLVPYQNVVTSDATIKKNSEMIPSFLGALHDAQQSILKGLSPEEAASLKKLVGSQMDDKVYNDTISQVQSLFQESFSTSDASWDAIVEVAEANTDASIEVPASDAIDNSFAEKIK
ncbi:ABC transporter substrate-binding protein [Nocardia sp. NPDC127606]|uniref:ABC transporter substrate-binding protein n=1 Tax=Nocardia sp. NPDC127606 TaxID=3345406 RepID=UPI0036364B63